MLSSGVFQDPSTGCVVMACVLQLPQASLQQQLQQQQQQLQRQQQQQQQPAFPALRPTLPLSALLPAPEQPAAQPVAANRSAVQAFGQPAIPARGQPCRMAMAGQVGASAFPPCGPVRGQQPVARGGLDEELFGRRAPEAAEAVVAAPVRRPEQPAAETVAPEDIPGQVWQLSREARGCRAVQEAFEAAPNDSAREALAAELRGHVWQAMRHRHANHVLQKCVMTMRPAAVQFIVDELQEKGQEGTVKVARHAYGCRVLQRLLEHCRPDQLFGLVEELLPEAVTLSKHVYGNFVMQHLAEFGEPGQQRRLLAELVRHAPELGRDIHSGAVLAKALEFGDRDDQLALARALVREEGLLATMAKTRHGSGAAKNLLETLEGEPESDEAHRQLCEEAGALRQRRYGRAVVACLGAEVAKQARDNSRMGSFSRQSTGGSSWPEAFSRTTTEGSSCGQWPASVSRTTTSGSAWPERFCRTSTGGSSWSDCSGF